MITDFSEKSSVLGDKMDVETTFNNKHYAAFKIAETYTRKTLLWSEKKKERRTRKFNISSLNKYTIAPPHSA